ncbi:MAG TPA: hypothetical protein VGX28_13340 [Frankiaceae bacterium]|jgi:hypothetical protein|nr:hypothetical protein [Frankiaceae bacterium]
MSRKLVAAALVAAAVATSAPSAFAVRQIVCRGTRTIHTTDADIQYPYFYLCG